MNYGLPYMGSKSKIVKHIVPLFPNVDNFVDLFAGGGAVTHYAMTTNKYKHFVYNDLNPLPIKEAYHYAVFFGDYSLAKERMGIDLTPLEKCPTIKEKYAMLKRIVKTTPSYQWEQGCSQWKDKGGFSEYGIPPKVLWQFESAERMWRCEEVAVAISGHNAKGRRKLPLSDVIEFYNTDYQAVPIPDNSVIYCDIPYMGTGTYQRHKKTEFDYERFYDWAYRQTQPIFISEYWMPEDRFVCIAEIKRTDTFSQNIKSKKVTERIFTPKHQQTEMTKQLNLF